MGTPDELYRILFSGKLLAGHNHDDVADRLAKLLKIPHDKAMRLIIGRKHYLKRDFDENKASLLSGQITRAGAECSIVPVSKIRKKKLPELDPPSGFALKPE